MKVRVTYEAKSLDELKEILGLTGGQIEVTPTKIEAKEEEVEVKTYSAKDLQALAVKANEAGKLSQIKAILDSHEIEKVSAVPSDLLDVVGQAFAEVVENA